MSRDHLAGEGAPHEAVQSGAHHAIEWLIGPTPRARHVNDVLCPERPMIPAREAQTAVAQHIIAHLFGRVYLSCVKREHMLVCPMTGDTASDANGQLLPGDLKHQPCASSSDHAWLVYGACINPSPTISSKVRRRPVIKQAVRTHGDVAPCGVTEVELSIDSCQEGRRFRNRLRMPRRAKIRGVSATASSRDCGRKFVHSLICTTVCRVPPKDSGGLTRW